MKFLVVVITLAISGAFGDAAKNDSRAETYVYLVLADRILNFAYPGNDVIAMPTYARQEMYITIKKAINPENPLTADVTIREIRKEPLIFSRDGLNLCTEYKNGSWEAAVVKVVNTNLFADEGCSVDPGTYPVGPLGEHSYVNVPKLPCDGYYIHYYLYSNKKLVMLAEYYFEISRHC